MIQNKEIAVKMKKNNNTDIIRASGMFRLARCPASYGLEKTLPDITTPESERGALLHRIVTDKLDTDNYNLTSEDIYAVNYCRSVIEELTAEDGIVTAERRFFYDDLFTGQIDWLQVRETENGEAEIDIVDFKFGQGYVQPAEDNLQLEAYAVLVDKNYFNVDSVNVYIIQPLAQNGKLFTLRRYDREALKEAERTIVKACTDALKPDAPYGDVGKHCAYCKAHGICVKQKENMEQIALKRVETFEITADNALQVAKQLEAYKEAKKQADEYAEAVEIKLIELLQSTDIDGLELKQGRKVEKIDTAKLGSLLIENNAMQASEYIEACKVSKTALIEILAEKGVKKTDAKKLVEKVIADHDCSTISFAKSTIKIIE